MLNDDVLARRPATAGMVGLAACMSTVLIWSGNTIVTKAAADVIAPSSIAFYRWLLALFVLAPFIAPSAWRNRSQLASHYKQIAMLAALGMVIYQCLAYEAAKTTSAVNMGIMLALMPLTSAFLASAFGAEQLRATTVLGGLVSLAGLVYLTSQGAPLNLLESGFHAGDGLMLIAVVANSLYGVLVKRWQLPIDIWQLLFWQILFATILLFPIWISGPISPITSENLSLVLYAAIPASLGAPLLWMVGIQSIGPAKTSLFINLVPIVVAMAAWAFLNEQLYAYHLIGGVVTFVGVGIGLIKNTNKAPA